MDSYILRLYRRGNCDQECVAGLLEEVDAGTQAAFRSFEELRDLLQTNVFEKNDKVSMKNTDDGGPNHGGN